MFCLCCTLTHVSMKRRQFCCTVKILPATTFHNSCLMCILAAAKEFVSGSSESVTGTSISVCSKTWKTLEDNHSITLTFVVNFPVLESFPFMRPATTFRTTAWTSEATSCTGSLLENWKSYAKNWEAQKKWQKIRDTISFFLYIDCPPGSVIPLFCQISGIVVSASTNEFRLEMTQHAKSLFLVRFLDIFLWFAMSDIRALKQQLWAATATQEMAQQLSDRFDKARVDSLFRKASKLHWFKMFQTIGWSRTTQICPGMKSEQNICGDTNSSIFFNFAPFEAAVEKPWPQSLRWKSGFQDLSCPCSAFGSGSRVGWMNWDESFIRLQVFLLHLFSFAPNLATLCWLFRFKFEDAGLKSNSPCCVAGFHEIMRL